MRFTPINFRALSEIRSKAWQSGGVGAACFARFAVRRGLSAFVFRRGGHTVPFAYVFAVVFRMAARARRKRHQRRKERQVVKIKKAAASVDFFDFGIARRNGGNAARDVPLFRVRIGGFAAFERDCSADRIGDVSVFACACRARRDVARARGGDLIFTVVFSHGVEPFILYDRFFAVRDRHDGFFGGDFCLLRRVRMRQ